MPSCPQCSAAIPDSSIDRERDIATCASCGRVIDLRAQSDGTAATAGAARMRKPVPLPPGIQLTTYAPPSGGYRESGSSGIAITRRWLRGKHYAMLLIPLIAASVVAYFWAQDGFSLWLLFGAVFVLGWTYLLATMFLNRTIVRALSGRVEVQHGPLPNLQMARNITLEAGSIEQLFVARFGAAFAVKARMKDGSVVDLVAPLVAAEQAIFVEQQLERVLGLVDFAIDGELDEAYSTAVGATSGKPAAGGRVAAALIGPLVAAVAIGTFLMASSSTLEGTLTAKPELGGWSLTPDECSSGQRQGFHGVEVRSSADPSRVVRFVRDPVNGDSVVIEETSPSRRTVLGPDRCPRFRVALQQTDTSINEVWVMEGNASLDCDVVSGHVNFAGCH